MAQFIYRSIHQSISPDVLLIPDTFRLFSVLVVAGRVSATIEASFFFLSFLYTEKTVFQRDLCFPGSRWASAAVFMLFLLLRGENNELRFFSFSSMPLSAPHSFISDIRSLTSGPPASSGATNRSGSVLLCSSLRLSVWPTVSVTPDLSGSLEAPSASSPHRISISSGGRLRAWSSSGLKPSRCGTGVAQVDEKTITSLSSIGSEWWRARHCLLTRGELDGLYGGVGRPVSGFKMLSFPNEVELRSKSCLSPITQPSTVMLSLWITEQRPIVSSPASLSIVWDGSGRDVLWDGVCVLESQFLNLWLEELVLQDGM